MRVRRWQVGCILRTAIGCRPAHGAPLPHAEFVTHPALPGGGIGREVA